MWVLGTEHRPSTRAVRALSYPQMLSSIYPLIQQAFVDQLYVPNVAVGTENFEMDETDGVHGQMEFLAQNINKSHAKISPMVSRETGMT